MLFTIKVKINLKHQHVVSAILTVLRHNSSNEGTPVIVIIILCITLTSF